MSCCLSSIGNAFGIYSLSSIDVPITNAAEEQRGGVVPARWQVAGEGIHGLFLLFLLLPCRSVIRYRHFPPAVVVVVWCNMDCSAPSPFAYSGIRGRWRKS